MKNSRKGLYDLFAEEPTPKRVGSFVEVEGDLMKLTKAKKFDFMGHGCNCFAMFAAGIAVAVKTTFPEMQKADKEYSSYTESWEKLGNFSRAKLKGIPTIGINFYSQYYPGPDFSEEGFILALRKFAIWKKETSPDELWSIGLPLIGCGIAGGDWKRVKRIIKKELEEFDVTIVHFNG